MLSKYLSGMVRVKSKEEESKTKLTRAIFLMRKTDVVQHSDMARFVNFQPDSGGFIEQFIREPELEFYGESVSCRVKTKPELQDQFNVIIQNPVWFKHHVGCDDEWRSFQSYWLFQILDANANVEPFNGPRNHINWEPCTQVEASALMLKEFEDKNG